ncbi:site-specific tyrosine recombinase XerC [candidate division CSSED10-310 bacterium]|uniref:Site-specific tyrosine recombinase XerC n=1 Tax=candidate division CSSED10-310 bacterium TaxID=2855610 RepID=A0ABV6YZN9_UNCC1
MTDHYLKGDDRLSCHIRKFLTWLAVSNFSPGTVENRRKLLTTFRNWCVEREITTYTTISRKHLEQYQRFLFNKTKSNGMSLRTATQSNYLTAVRVFFSWLTRNNYILCNPASEVELPRPDKMLPRNILTPAEVDLLMDQPDVTTGFGTRDRAILETFYSTGIRRSELAFLALKDVDPDRGVLIVRQGKGGKDRVVPLGRRAVSWLEKYLVEVRPYLIQRHDCQTLFLTQYGEAFHPDVLTRMVNKYIRKSSIECSGGCHVLRHSMATSMLENGADIRYIQKMLGHESLDTTQIYTKVSILKLKEVHSQTHPARRKSDLE